VSPQDAPGAIPPEYDAYVQSLRQRIQAHLRYPWLAARRGLQGVVELEVRLSTEGRLAGVDVIGGVAAGLLREAALRAVRDATPFPLPAGVDGRPLTVRLPVVFELR
jgi:protein TonB